MQEVSKTEAVIAGLPDCSMVAHTALAVVKGRSYAVVRCLASYMQIHACDFGQRPAEIMCSLSQALAAASANHTVWAYNNNVSCDCTLGLALGLQVPHLDVKVQ